MPSKPPVTLAGTEFGASRLEEIAVREALERPSNPDAHGRGGPRIEVDAKLALGDPTRELGIGEVRETQAGPVAADIRSEVQRAPAATRVRPPTAKDVVAPIPVDTEWKILSV